MIPSRNSRIAVAGLGAIGCYFLVKNVWHSRFLPSKNKVVLVTGCDTPLGFGCAIVRRLHQLGYAVFAGCLDAKTAELIYSDLLSPSFHVIQLDVTKQSEVDRAREEIANWLKENPDFRFFGIVSNAGVGVVAPMEWLKMETFFKIFDVNFFGAIRVTKAFLPLIRGSGDGRVVIMASLAGEVPGPLGMPYSASKAALLACCECLDVEVARFGVKVSAILPDFYRTNIVVNTQKSVADLEQEKSGLNPEIFEAYGGEKFLGTLKKVMEAVPKFAKTDLTPVVDCTVDALASPCPKRRYYPIEFANRIAKGIYFVAPSVLKSLHERLMNFGNK